MYFVTGFCNGESTFSVSTYKDKALKSGWRILPVFTIELHGKDRTLLNDIKSFFSVGRIAIRSRDEQVIYYVNSLKNLTEFIIPRACALINIDC